MMCALAQSLQSRPIAIQVVTACRNCLIQPQGQVEAGLLLFYNDRLFCGVAMANGSLRRYKLGHAMTYPLLDLSLDKVAHFKLVYKEDVASFYTSRDADIWHRIMTFDVSGYNHNMGGDLLSLRPALFATGKGAARFEQLVYTGAL